jgi:imidazolonepropionase-like amidohydrolase
MRMADQIGLVKSGYLADLLIVDGNPLRDIAILQNKNAMKLIMQAGTIHKLSTGARTAH